jgi:hypothetical protein
MINHMAAIPDFNDKQIQILQVAKLYLLRTLLGRTRPKNVAMNLLFCLKERC